MSYPYPPQYQPPPPPRTADATVAIVLLVIGAVIWGLGAFFGLFVLAFLDDCPPESCSAGNAFLAVAAGVGAGMVVGVAAIVLVVRRIKRRQLSWPIALAAPILVLGFQIAAGFGFYAAV